MRKAILNYVWFVAEGFIVLAVFWGLGALISSGADWILRHWLIFGWLAITAALLLGTMLAQDVVAGVAMAIIVGVLYGVGALVLYLVGVKLFDWIAWIPSLPFRSLWVAMGAIGFFSWLYFKVGQTPKDEPSPA